MSQSITAYGPGTAPPGAYLGVNLATLDYFETQFPFLNVYKTSNTNSTNKTGIAWETAPTAAQAGDLQLDLDGYVTSLTGISGQTFSSVFMYTFVNVPLAPGASARFPPGPYRLRFTGKGTIVLSGQVSTITAISNTGAGVSSFSGLTITSPTTGDTTVTLTVPDGGGGIVTTITALPDVANYIHNMSLVQVSQAANFDAGKIYHPTFMAALANVSQIRVKDWQKNDIGPQGIQFGVALGIGTTTALMQTYNYVNSTWGIHTWARPTGVYLLTFTSGEQINANFTWNSNIVTFAALKKVVPFDGTSYNMQAFYPSVKSWADRATFTDFSWCTDKGVPYEVSFELANQLNNGSGIDCMPSLPATTGWISGADMGFVNGLGNLCFNGSGTTLPGFTGLKKMCIPEWSNETWNTGYPTQAYSVAIAPILMPGLGGDPQQKSSEYRGAMQAIIADAWYAIYGAAAFAARVLVSVGGQTAWTAAGGSGSWGLYYTIAALDTPHWTSAAKTHHIGAIHFSPYIGYRSSVTTLADKNAILATASPIDTIFQLAYTNVAGGVTYASIASQGWAGFAKYVFDGLIAGLASYGLPIVCYEAGTDFFASGQSAGWISLCSQAHYDPRIEYILHDPGNVLWTTYGITGSNGQKGLFQTMKTAGVLWMDFFNFCIGPSQYGEWGLVDSVMQPVLPLASAPAKYRAAQKFMQGL